MYVIIDYYLGVELNPDQTHCTHSGNVWHGSQEPWHNWDILAGRFVSEFGMYDSLLSVSA